MSSKSDSDSAKVNSKEEQDKKIEINNLIPKSGSIKKENDNDSPLYSEIEYNKHDIANTGKEENNGEIKDMGDIDNIGKDKENHLLSNKLLLQKLDTHFNICSSLLSKLDVLINELQETNSLLKNAALDGIKIKK